MNFASTADQLDRQEYARLEAARTPRIEAFRSMTSGSFADEVAGMMERLNHTVVTVSPWLVTTKDGRKYVTACANPADQATINMPAIRRLHDALIAAGAFRGIYVTPRSFTLDAEHYAAHAPIDLVDGPLLIKSMQRSRRGVLLPHTYRTMCRQCGDVVQHRLDRNDPLPCANGHFVAPPKSFAAFIPYRPPPGAPQPGAAQPVPAYAPHPAGPHPSGTVAPIIRSRSMTAKAQRRRAVKAHNRRLYARPIKARSNETLLRYA
jgi:hypothetical protein